jgi:hypothetical protein
MISLQKTIPCLALAAALPILVLAQDRADKYNYSGIYTGRIPTDLLNRSGEKNRVKSQLVVYPDGRLLVLTVESSSFNIQGSLKKNVFTGQSRKGLFQSGQAISCRALFYPGAAILEASVKNKKGVEKWYFSKS